MPRTSLLERGLARPVASVRALIALATLVVCACGPHHHVEHLTLEPLVIHVAADGTSSAESPDPELEALAEKEEKGDCAGALPGLERFLEDFPESSRFLEAVYRLGVCEEELGHLERARGYYLYVASRARGEPAAQGALRGAFVLETMGKPESAADEYDIIAERAGASEEARVGARLRRAICLFRAAKIRSAKRELEDAIAQYSSLPTPSDSIRSGAAEARFASAEHAAADFEGVKLEYPQKKMNRRLAEKARRMRVARDAYTDVVALKDAEWAAAAVYRIGEMSEHFYRDLVEVPPPSNLTASQQAAYAAKVEIKAKPLKQQAFEAYLRVVALGERVGIENPWVEKSRARVQALEPELKNEVLSSDPHANPDDD